MRIERGQDPGPFSRHTQYKSHLQHVFRRRCAYCLTPDHWNGGFDGMTVDHFRPVTRYPDLRLNWSNLYYSCFPCNSHYKKDHPTAEEEAQGLRFVDPCREDPDNHFRMTRDPKTGDLCRVRPLSQPARYTERILRFNERKALRDFWRELDQLQHKTMARIDEIKSALENVRLHLQHCGVSEEIQAIRSDYEHQLQEQQNSLDRILSTRPFPVAQEDEPDR